MKLTKEELSIIFANYIGQWVMFERDKTFQVDVFGQIHILGTIVEKILDDSVTFNNLNQLRKIYDEIGIDDNMIKMMLLNIGIESLTEYMSLEQEEAYSKKEMFAATLKAMNEPLLNKLNATV